MGHKTLDQIKALQVQVALQQKEVTTVIAGLPAADAKLTMFAGQITQVDNWIVGCLATGNCANPPKFCGNELGPPLLALGRNPHRYR